jgi:hypothetical protein
MDYIKDDTMYHNNNGGGGGSWIAMWVIAVIFFVVIFIFGIVALVLLVRSDRKHDNGIGEVVAGAIAAKSLGGNGCGCGCGGNGNGNYHALYEKMDNNEVKAGIASVKAEVGAVSLFLSKNQSDYEMKNLEQFGEIKKELGMQSQALTQLLTISNNGVINRLTYLPKCG